MNLRESLSRGLVQVTFEKRDGSERVMICTTDMDLIPVDSHPKGIRENTNPEHYRVYDVEKDGWRSFHADQIISVSVQ